VSNGVAVAVTVVAGGLIALQPAFNSELGKATGDIPAATINFLAGTLTLVVILLLIGQASRVADASGVPWYYVVGGGMLGAIYVTTALLTVLEIGAGGVTAATITGQLAVSIVMDRFGLFGLAETAITAEKIVGVVLLLAGTLLIIR
jgi:transporter family-2 protein